MHRYTPLMLVIISLCGCSTSLPVCPADQVRAWCLIDVTARTWDYLENETPGGECKKQIALTKCVPDSGSKSSNIIAMISTVTRYLRSTYTSGSAQFVITDTGVVTADFAHDAKGYTQCFASDQQTVPWPGTPVVPLAERVAWTRQALGGGGDSAASDCSACLADGCADVSDPVMLAACSQQHCAALCPVSPASLLCDGTGAGGASTVTLPSCMTSPGMACSAAIPCCPPYACSADGVCQ
jgi:hypothetical protein